MSLEAVKEIDVNLKAAISRFLSLNPALPVFWKEVSPPAYCNYLANWIKHTLDHNEKSALIVGAADEIEGLALLRFGEWDSAYFKKPIGYIDFLYSNRHTGVDDISGKFLRHCITEAVNLGFKIIYIYLKPDRFELIKSLGASGFQLICSEIRGIYSQRELAYASISEDFEAQYTVRDYHPEDEEQIINISKELTQDLESRFTLTPWLAEEKTRNYYREAVTSACSGHHRDHLFVLAEDEKVHGFIVYEYDDLFEVACEKRLSFCTMLGMKRAKRKRNLGQQFSSAAQRLLLTEKAGDIIMYKTFLHNENLIRLILKRKYMPRIEFLHTFAKHL